MIHFSKHVTTLNYFLVIYRHLLKKTILDSFFLITFFLKIKQQNKCINMFKQFYINTLINYINTPASLDITQKYRFKIEILLNNNSYINTFKVKKTRD